MFAGENKDWKEEGHRRFISLTLICRDFSHSIFRIRPLTLPRRLRDSEKKR